MTEPEDIIINSYNISSDNGEVPLKEAAEQMLTLTTAAGYPDLFPGCCITGMKVEVQGRKEDGSGGTPHIFLDLDATPQSSEDRVCPQCGSRHCHIASWYERKVMDSSIGGARVTLNISVPRYICNDCQKTYNHEISFLHPHHRITKRLYMQVTLFLEWSKGSMSLTEIEKMTGLDADIIKSIDKAILVEKFKDIPTDGVKNIALDEIAVKKRHRYISVIIDADTRRLLFAAYGRKKEDLKPFFDILRERGHLDNIVGAVMDGNAGYQHMVKEMCPGAAIILDLFHCLQLYTKQVIDAQRLSMTDHLKKEISDNLGNEAKRNVLKAKYKLVKGAKWATYQGLEKLKDSKETSDAVKELIMSNSQLTLVCSMRDSLKELWKKHRTPAQVSTAVDNWINMAEQSGNIFLSGFAKKIKKWKLYILHAAETGLSNSVLEGCNNKFKVIKRVAYGFRDIGYFILKLHHALAEDRAPIERPSNP